MGIEKKFNQFGQEQIIDNFDKIIKMDDKLFLQVRLIKTRKWKQNGFTHSMPRAKFINPNENNIHYIVSRDDLIKLKKKNLRRVVEML
jgi:hypothetical protein